MAAFLAGVWYTSQGVLSNRRHSSLLKVLRAAAAQAIRTFILQRKVVRDCSSVCDCRLMLANTGEKEKQTANCPKLGK